MNSIPPYSLPSNPKVTVYFREPTVSDSIDFCALNESLEELSTTTFLNRLQEGTGKKINDSINWTGQDRRTALWWIFIATTDDTELAYNYHCEHCGNEHIALIDLIELDDTATSIVGKPYIEDEIVAGGMTHKVRFVPFSGYALQEMEEARINRDSFPQDSAEYKRIAAEIRMLEVVHSFLIISDKKLPNDEQAEKRVELVQKMKRMTEFKPLAEKAYLARKALDHGVLAEVVDGRFQLVSPPQHCKEKGGEDNSTIILMPFRYNDFIPEI